MTLAVLVAAAVGIVIGASVRDLFVQVERFDIFDDDDDDFEQSSHVRVST